MIEDILAFFTADELVQGLQFECCFEAFMEAYASDEGKFVDIFESL